MLTMNREKYSLYVEKYVREAVEKSGGDVEMAYMYLRDKRNPFRFSPSSLEKNYALRDLRHHFLAFRIKPMQDALESLGMMVANRANDPRRR